MNRRAASLLLFAALLSPFGPSAQDASALFAHVPDTAMTSR